MNPNSILQSISFDLLKSLIVQVHPHLLLGGWHNGHLWASSSQLWNEVTKRKLPLEDNFFSGEEGFSKGADLKSQTAKVCLTTFSKPTIIMVRHLILNITDVSPAVDGRSPEFYHLAHVHPGAELNVFGRLSLIWSSPTTQSPYNTCLQGFQSNRSRPSCTEVMPWKLLHIPKKCHSPSPVPSTSPSPVPSTWGNSKNCSGIWRRQASTFPQCVKSP